MSKKKKKQTRSIGSFLVSADGYETLCVTGYTRLSDNPEIVAACRRISEIISGMTIHLISNTEKGDKRIVNELSRKVDIHPNRWMTRRTWMDIIVMNMLLYGKGNSIVLPQTDNGYLGDMIPIDPDKVSFREDGYGYKVLISGIEYDPNEILHFVDNPDPHYPWKGMGVTTTLKDVVNNLKQAAATEKAFMESKWKPSVIVKVDAMTEEFASKDGRKKLLESYIESSEVGEPWLIPAEQFSVDQIRPLSLADLAINDAVVLDKKTVAAVMGIPAFVLGVGEYKKDEWDAFISNKIRPLCREIEQELTRKLILSDKWYWRLNIASQYSYDLKTTQEVYSDLYVRGIVTGNEVREKMSMEPMEGLDELVILENYIPLGKIGDQLKLGEGNNE